MRLIHAIRSVNPAGGGVIEALKQFALAHRDMGHAAEVVSLDPPDAPWVRDFQLPLHAMGSATQYGYSPKFVPWLREHLCEWDAVVVHGLWQYGSFGTWRALRGTSTPYFVFPHGMLDPWFKQHAPLKHLKKLLYWPWAEARVLRDAAAVLFTCEEERRLARESFWLYRCREVVVPLGIAAPPAESATARDAFFSRFPELRGRRLVLFLGRLHPKKGCDLVVEAFRRVCEGEGRDGLHLVMAGPESDAPFVKSLRARSGERVTWTGMLSGDLKWGAIRASEVFILPSHQENFGIAVVEALACGVPVLISNKVNIWREVEAGGAGFVEDDDVEGAQRLLDRWLFLSETRREEMGMAAGQCFAAQFDIRQSASKLLDVCRK